MMQKLCQQMFMIIATICPAPELMHGAQWGLFEERNSVYPKPGSEGSSLNPFNTETGSFEPGSGNFSAPHNWTPYYIIAGIVTVIAGGVMGYKKYMQSQCEKTIKKLQRYRETIEQIATRYTQEDHSLITPEQLEQRFTTNQGQQPSNPSIQQKLANVKLDLSQIEQLIATIKTAKASWKDYNPHQEAINTHADALLLIADESYKLLKLLEHDVAQGIEPINLRILYHQIKTSFQQIIDNLEYPKQLEQLIRLKFTKEDYPYPHITCTAQAKKAFGDLQAAELKVQSPKFSSFVQESCALRTKLQNLGQKIAGTETFRQQLIEKNRAQEIHAQTVAAQQHARAEETRARAEIERVIEARRANDLKEAELRQREKEREAQIAQTLATAANAVSHSSCNQKISALEQANATQRHNLLRAQEEVNRLTAVIRSLQDSTNTMTSNQSSLVAKIQAQLNKLEQEITRPPFNPESIETDNDQPGSPTQFMKWHQAILNKLKALRKELGSINNR